MSAKEYTKRYILFVISLFFSGLGVAVTKRGDLGVSPISSVANVLSIKYPVLSIGWWLLIWNCVLIVGQIVLLRKDFKPIQLLQVPLSVLFAVFTDMGMAMTGFLASDIYIVRLLCVAAGTVILGFGIALSVAANVIMNSGEAFVKAISDIAKKPFGNVKICFDVSCVLISVLLSLVLFDMRIAGTREGTIIAALCTGITVKLFQKLFGDKPEKLLKG